jgi:hypothetical protein
MVIDVTLWLQHGFHVVLVNGFHVLVDETSSSAIKDGNRKKPFLMEVLQ